MPPCDAPHTIVGVVADVKKAGLHSVIFALVLSQSQVILLAGLVVGTGCALWLSRVLQNMRYGFSGSDPATFVDAMLLLLVTGCSIGTRGLDVQDTDL